MQETENEMAIPFTEFLNQIVHNPVLLVTTILTLAVILVNGWTDAPNAIATCISTRSISARSAILMAAIFNFLGVFVMTMINANVALLSCDPHTLPDFSYTCAYIGNAIHRHYAVRAPADSAIYSSGFMLMQGISVYKYAVCN